MYQAFLKFDKIESPFIVASKSNILSGGSFQWSSMHSEIRNKFLTIICGSVSFINLDIRLIRHFHVKVLDENFFFIFDWWNRRFHWVYNAMENSKIQSAPFVILQYIMYPGITRQFHIVSCNICSPSFSESKQLLWNNLLCTP